MDWLNAGSDSCVAICGGGAGWTEGGLGGVNCAGCGGGGGGVTGRGDGCGGVADTAGACAGYCIGREGAGCGV